ncbi:MAG: transposase [Elusimicrobia bacterium]|nr:transposase [Elusimicrobiota bacterium]
MPRRARFTIEDGTYHVMIRGNNRNPIFQNSEDFSYFMELIKDNKEKYNLKVYHYVLMNNHIHIIIKSVIGKNLSEAMKRMMVSYMRYYRKLYKGIGHFFQDRFKSFLIQDGKYLLECGRYVELNPVSAGIVKYPNEYKWSSYKVYAEGEKSNLIDINPEYMGLSEDIDNRKKRYKEYINDGLFEQRTEERFFKEGAYGSVEFKEILKKRGLKPIWSHGGCSPKVGKS